MIKLIKQLSDRPIAFHRAYVNLTGSITSALMLSQAMYWTSRTDDADGWFYKTQKDWEEETGLSRREQETARARLKNAGFWEEKLRGIPATMYYRLDLEKLASCLSGAANPAGEHSADKHAQNSQSIFTETTTETTTDTSSPKGDGTSSAFLFPDQESKASEPSKKAARQKNEDFPEYTRFIDAFNAKYPHMLTFPRDGAKVKSLIKQCRQQLTARGKDPTPEHVVAFWEIFVGNLGKTWGHGKDLSTIDSKFNSLVFEIEHGKKQTDNDRYNARTAAQRYVDNL